MLSRIPFIHFREMLPLVLLIPCYYAGKYIQEVEDLRMTHFRDQSALYGGQVKPGEPPSWP